MEQQIKVSCQKSNLKKIRTFLKECLAGSALPSTDAHLVVVAVDEVCANLMIHSHNCNPKVYIELRLYEADGYLTIDIYDQGDAFNIDTYQEPPLEKVIQDRKSGGMGLILVKRIMDHISVLQSQGYNIYRMQKAI